ncbi:MAG: hypothetical protein J0L52_05090 [Caulobacterales bacterium]|nr:hypothetical protein [Caulobacterales bacterium]
MMLLSVALAATPAVAGPADTYFERSLVAAAGARCQMFDAATAHALEAGVAQSRGAALRAGSSETELSDRRIRALSQAGRIACDDRELSVVAERVRSAFSAWARTPRMDFPGERSAWQVVRSAYASQSWRVRQDGDRVIFGFAGAGTGHTLALAVEDEQVVTARLIVRDPGRAPSAWLARAGMADTPPASASRVFMAGRGRAVPETLNERGGKLFRFSTAAANAIGQLDPRERFAVELVQPNGATRVVTLGAGDFAAARAFLAMGTL